jgi:voltage-gated potassium channel
MTDSDLGVALEELVILENGFATGKNLIESNIRHNYGIIIVAIKRTSGNMIFNPAPQEILKAGDILVVMGKQDDLVRLRKSI